MHVLVCADFNARTSDMLDYVQDDTATNIHVLSDEYAVDTPLSRVSEDKGFNRYGSELQTMGFCKQTGLRILNGRVGNNGNIGKCTYVGSTSKCLVDYVISSQQLFPLINTFDVDESNILSDHCVVICTLRSHRVNQTINIEDNSETCKYRYDHITKTRLFKYIENFTSKI